MTTKTQKYVERKSKPNAEIVRYARNTMTVNDPSFIQKHGNDLALGVLVFVATLLTIVTIAAL